jgi:hypothetical protein
MEVSSAGQHLSGLCNDASSSLRSGDPGADTEDAHARIAPFNLLAGAPRNSFRTTRYPADTQRGRVFGE